MADPSVIHCASECTITVQHELVFPPFQLSLAEASQIGVAILLIWAIGFSARAIVQVINPAGRFGDE